MAALVAALLLASPAGAATPAEEAFRDGVADSRIGDHEAAPAHFQAARGRGMATGALYYNLGVTYYRLGRLDEAARALEEAVDSGPMAAPALYQLGRVARERGNRQQANAYFRQAADRAQTDKLRRLALAALPSRPSTTTPPDLVYVFGGGGYDSNVAPDP